MLHVCTHASSTQRSADLGSTFLKQVLIELAADPAFLQQPVADEAQVEQAARPLWEYLDALHPHLWRGGETFPASGPAQRQLLDDRSEEHTSELQSLMRISYAVFCLKKKTQHTTTT